MASPEDRLPQPIPPEAIQDLLVSLGLPKATEITAPDVTASYHAIYQIQLATPVPAGKAVIAASLLDQYGSSSSSSQTMSELILRVAGRHLPGIKTLNEVGVMAWLARSPSTAATIPVPDVVAYDATTRNPLDHEYTLLARARGTTLSDVYPSLSGVQRDGVLDQLIDMLVALHGGVGGGAGGDTDDRKGWHHIGGLNLAADGSGGEVVPARIVDETFWKTGDLDLWPAGETVASLNLAGPYPSWPAMVAAQVRHYVRLIGLHDAFEFLREDEEMEGGQGPMVPRLLAFARLLEQPESEHPADWQLARTRLVLAHKDLHFANLMYNVEIDGANDFDSTAGGRITAVLDWEFSGVVPAPLWNPRRSFLWNAQPGADSSAATRALVAQFEARVQDRGDPNVTTLLLDSQKYVSPQQEAMQGVADYLRALVEVCPRGQRQELVGAWAAVVQKNLAVFGV